MAESSSRSLAIQIHPIRCHRRRCHVHDHEQMMITLRTLRQAYKTPMQTLHCTAALFPTITVTVTAAPPPVGEGGPSSQSAGDERLLAAARELQLQKENSAAAVRAASFPAPISAPIFAAHVTGPLLLSDQFLLANSLPHHSSLSLAHCKVIALCTKVITNSCSPPFTPLARSPGCKGLA